MRFKNPKAIELSETESGTLFNMLRDFVKLSLNNATNNGKHEIGSKIFKNNLNFAHETFSLFHHVMKPSSAILLWIVLNFIVCAMRDEEGCAQNYPRT